MWQKGKDGIWYCVKEFYYSGRDSKKQKTDSEFADELQKFTEGIRIKEVIVDPSAASFIAELKKRNFKIRKAKNDVLDGIRFVGTLLNEVRYFVYTIIFKSNKVKITNRPTWME